MSDYEVNLVEDSMQEFYVKFNGPKDTPYEGGCWKIHVELPNEYPYKSPSIGFQNKIFHPNIDEVSGSVCLDVINQTWSPMFDIFNIFEAFLPQLLSYPNAADPLNSEASSLYINDNKLYIDRVKTYVTRYANPSRFNDEGDLINEEEDNDKDLSMSDNDDDDDDDDSSSDEEIAGEIII